MTLHWWMHWFWVTALLMLAVPRRAGALPRPGEAEATTAAGVGARRGKAIYLQAKAAASTSAAPPASRVNLTSASDRPAPNVSAARPERTTLAPSPSTSEPPPEVTSAAPPPSPPASAADDATTAPPADETVPPRDELEVLESSARATERAWSLASAPAGRERSARTQRGGGAGGGGGSGLEAGAVAGVSLAALALVALAGTSGFVLYRRRYLNKPQTLHDKCSNPDSSGYLDDSTVRENSEEMYSLDNDSFLNSLEAMTIQNYWTDNVKHSKL